MSSGIRDRSIWWIAMVVLAIGAAARIRQFVFNRSLWLDEAALALNIVRHDFRGLLLPMDDFQTAPVGFLWGQKLLITALGNSDFVLRLIPLGAGLGSLFLMYSLIRPLNTAPRQWAGLTALLLLAVTGPLIYYSSEAKQYSTDVLATLALLVVARRCLRENASPRDFWWLGIVGAATIWISHPSVFAIAGVSSALVLSQTIRRIPGRWTPIVGAAVLPAASLGALYLIVLRAQVANIRPLQEYWSEGFAPLPPWINWMWYGRAAWDALSSPLELSPEVLAAAFLLAGLVSLLLRRWPLATGLAASLFAIFAASGLQLYPFRGRLLLFSVPVAFLLLGEGVGRTYSLLTRIGRPIALGAAGLMVAALLHAPALHTADKFLHPYTHEEIKPVMIYVAARRSPDDLVYVYWRAVPAVTYYAPSYGMAGSDFIAGSEGGTSADPFRTDIDQLAARGRAWFVFNDRCSNCRLDERYYLSRLGRLGVRLDEIRSDGAAAFLYEFSGVRQPSD